MSDLVANIPSPLPNQFVFSTGTRDYLASRQTDDKFKVEYYPPFSTNEFGIWRESELAKNLKKGVWDYSGEPCETVAIDISSLL